jgi:hypothetical protein
VQDQSPSNSSLCMALGFSEDAKRPGHFNFKNAFLTAQAVHRRGINHIQNFHYKLNTEAIEKRITSFLRTYWGPRFQVYAAAQSNGTIACVAHWQKDLGTSKRILDDRTTPTLIAWTIAFKFQNGNFRIDIGNIFFMGAHYPKPLVPAIAKSSVKGVLNHLSSEVEVKSLFSFEIPEIKLVAGSFLQKNDKVKLSSIAADLLLEGKLTLEIDQASGDIIFQLFEAHKNHQIHSPTAMEEVLLTWKQSTDELAFDINLFRQLGKPHSDLKIPRSKKLIAKIETSNAESQDLQGPSLLKMSDCLQLSLSQFESLQSPPIEAFGDLLDVIESKYKLMTTNPTLYSILLEHVGDLFIASQPKRSIKMYQAIAQMRPLIVRTKIKLASALASLDQKDSETEILKELVTQERRSDIKHKLLTRLFELQTSQQLWTEALDSLTIMLSHGSPEALSSLPWRKLLYGESPTDVQRIILELLLSLDGRILGNKSSEEKAPVSLISKYIHHDIQTIYHYNLGLWQGCLDYYNQVVSHPDQYPSDIVAGAEEALRDLDRQDIIDHAKINQWHDWDVNTKKQNVDFGLQILEHTTDRDLAPELIRILLEVLSLGQKPTYFLDNLKETKWTQQDWSSLTRTLLANNDTLNLEDAECATLHNIEMEHHLDSSKNIAFIFHLLAAKRRTISSIISECEALKLWISNATDNSWLEGTLKSDSIASSLTSLLQSNEESIQMQAVEIAFKLQLRSLHQALATTIFNLRHHDATSVFLKPTMKSELVDQSGAPSTLIDLVCSLAPEELTTGLRRDLNDLVTGVLHYKFIPENRSAFTKLLRYVISIDDQETLLQGAFELSLRLKDESTILETLSSLLQKEELPARKLMDLAYKYTKNDAVLTKKLTLLDYFDSLGESKIEKARTLVELYVNAGVIDQDFESILTFITQQHKWQESDLASLHFLSSLHTNSDVMLQALLSQAHVIVDPTIQKQAYLFAAQYGAQIAPQYAFAALKHAYASTPTVEESLKLANAAREAGELDQCFDISATYLRSPNCMETPDYLLAFAKLLCQSDEQKGFSGSIIHTLIEWCEVHDRIPLKNSLISLALEFGVAERLLMKNVMIQRASNFEIDAAVETFMNYVKKIEPAEASKAMEDLKQDVAVATNAERWWLLLKEATQNAAFHRLPEEVRREIRKTLALHTFATKPDSPTLVDDLWNLYEDRPYDNKVWLPLYFTLQSRQSTRRLVTLLDGIIPTLEFRPEALEQYPITIETLKSSLKKARSQLVADGEKGVA